MYCTAQHHQHRARCPELNLNSSVQHHETFCECPVADWGRGWGGSWPTFCSSSGSVCLWVFSLSLCGPTVSRQMSYHGCFGLCSFIKGSGVSESLWCFLSRGGSTLLQRVHEGERMYPPLGSIGWWEPGDQTHNSLLPAGIQSLGRYRCI